MSQLDLKKRRLSGRDQILSGGEHLIDGVPFGRHRLRIPRGRPPVHIAPRKRRRLNYDENYDADDFDEYLSEDEDFDEYTESRPQLQDDDKESEQQLLLTEAGGLGSRASVRRVHFPDDDEGSADEDPTADDYDEDDLSSPDPQQLSQELADELDDLKALAEEEEYGRRRSSSEPDGRERFHTPNEDVHEHTEEQEEQDTSSAGNEGKMVARTKSTRQMRLQSLASQKSGVGRSSQEPDASVAQSPSLSLDVFLLDKITAIRSAFPQVSSSVCQKLLMKCGKDVSKAYRTLEKSLQPRQGLAETMVLSTQLELPREVMIVSSPERQPAEHLGEVSRLYEDEEDRSSSDENEDSDDSMDSSDEDSDRDDSDSDTSSKATPTRPSPRVKKTVEDSSTDSSEDSSSDSDSDSESEGDDPTPRRRNNDSSQGQSPAHQTDSSGSSSAESSSSDSSSEPEAPVVRRTNARRGRRMVVHSSQSSPANSKALKVSSQNTTRRTARDRLASKASSDVDMANSELDEEDRPLDKAATKPSTSTPTKSTSQTKPDAISESQTSSQPLVPPGQGKTKTQRRNQRRRLENQRKKAALEAASSEYQGSQNSAITDMLAAKKNALLQSLGSQSQAISEAAGNARASPAVNETPKSIVTPSQDADHWKQKISYRAVECVQEGIVDISEPPFPFYQRWDPQLRQDFRSMSQRKNKRKSRDNSQFYDSSSQPSHKRQRQDEYSRQVVDESSYRDDTATFLANQDDTTLNYDDISINANDSQPPSNKEEVEDDLPKVPEDMSSLPELMLKDLAEGAVVAWKQLLCTQATNWQPQMSDWLTAVIVEADSVRGHLQVQLAKRDRDVDKNEKRFDEETGQRIYGKFEPPDEDDGDEEDQGFRDVMLSQMMDARLLQAAEHPPEEPAANGVEENHTHAEQNDGPTADEAPQLSELDFEVADSQPKRNSNDVSGTSGSDQNQSRTLDNDTQSRMEQHGQDEPQDMDVDTTSPSGVVEESFIAETNRDIQLDEDEDDDPADFVSPAEEVSITDERRQEISQLINAEGFRQEVRASIDRSSFLRLGSPSRQLEEEYASSIAHKASSQAESSEAPSEYGSKDPSQQVNQQQLLDVGPDAFHSAPQTPQAHQTSSVEPGSQQTEKPEAPTKRAQSPILELSQITEVSARSGRQPDDNIVTHSDDLGVELPTESPGMLAFDDLDDAFVGESDNVDAQPAGAQIPTQSVFNHDLQTSSAVKAAAMRSKLPNLEMSPVGSVSSSSSSDSFPDIEVLWAQAASQKFKEASVAVKDEPSSQVNFLGSEDLPILKGPSATQPIKAATPQQEDTKEFWSSPARSTRSSGKGKGNDSANSTPKAKLKMATFDASVSPPALSKPRRRPASRASQGSTDKVKKTTPKGKRKSGSQFTIPEGSQVVSLMTSSPERPEPQADDAFVDEPEEEPEYTEMYAEDSMDEDYHGDSFNSFKSTQQKKPRRVSKSRAARGASMPVAETKEKESTVISTNWVPGSQGPSRKATGRFGGRWSSMGV